MFFSCRRFYCLSFLPSNIPSFQYSFLPLSFLFFAFFLHSQLYPLFSSPLGGGGGEQVPTLDAFEAPTQSILVTLVKEGIRGARSGVPCTIVRARQKGSRVKEVLVRGSYNPVAWRNAVLETLKTLPADEEDGTILLADVVKMLETPECKLLLPLAGASNKVCV